MIWLLLLALLGAVDAGLAKPYCSWQEGYGCLETSDNETSTCGHSKYTDLVMNLQACLNRTNEDFTGCKEPEPDSDQSWNCSNFPVLGVFTPVPTSDYAAWGLVCLPYSQAIEDLRASFDLERAGDTNNNTTTTAFKMEAALARVNVCEGRQVAPGRIVKSGNGIDLTISAPCTCLQAVGETPACTGIKVQDEAKAQCDDCKNDLDTWVSDYLKRGDCVATIQDAAPLQALCRTKSSRETCEGVNKACDDACGRPESSPQSPVDTPVPSTFAGSNGMPTKQMQDAGEMSAAATVRGSTVAVAVVAAATTGLLAAWGG